MVRCRLSTAITRRREPGCDRHDTYIGVTERLDNGQSIAGSSFTGDLATARQKAVTDHGIKRLICAAIKMLSIGLMRRRGADQLSHPRVPDVPLRQPCGHGAGIKQTRLDSRAAPLNEITRVVNKPSDELIAVYVDPDKGTLYAR